MTRIDHLPRAKRELHRLRPARLTPDSVPWDKVPARDEPWIPDDLLPLGDGLADGQRLRYGQYYALECAEQFLWLESNFILAPLRQLLATNLPR